MINLLDFYIVVFGGGLFNIEDIYREVFVLVGNYIFLDVVEM